MELEDRRQYAGGTRSKLTRRSTSSGLEFPGFGGQGIRVTDEANVHANEYRASPSHVRVHQGVVPVSSLAACSAADSVDPTHATAHSPLGYAVGRWRSQPCFCSTLPTSEPPVSRTAEIDDGRRPDSGHGILVDPPELVSDGSKVRRWKAGFDGRRTESSIMTNPRH
jgi:hypothetical protein